VTVASNYLVGSRGVGPGTTEDLLTTSWLVLFCFLVSGQPVFGQFPRNIAPGIRGCRRKGGKKTTYLYYIGTVYRNYLPASFLRFFEVFRSNFRKYLYGVFGLLQRNGQNRDKKNRCEDEDDRKKVFFSLNFFGQKFLTWTSSKKFLWCF
jgi:hypothetical protein